MDRSTNPAATADCPIDHQVLGRLLCDDRTAIVEVMRQFLATCPAEARALGEALGAGEAKAVLRCAHRLKGACRMVGADALADVCERIERAVRSSDRRLLAVAEQLRREARRVEAYLHEWLAPAG